MLNNITISILFFYLNKSINTSNSGVKIVSQRTITNPYDKSKDSSNFSTYKQPDFEIEFKNLYNGSLGNTRHNFISNKEVVNSDKSNIKKMNNLMK